MEKKTALNGCSVFISAISSYDAANGSCASSSVGQPKTKSL
jgi:hypothetical protein